MSFRLRRHTTVNLTRDVGKWPAGTTASVLDDDGRTVLLEVTDQRSLPLDLLTVDPEEVIVRHIPEPRRSLHEGAHRR